MKPPEALQPVLVIGVARSGTSWVGRALGYARDARYIFEPDNVDADITGATVPGARGFGPYPVIDVAERHPDFEVLWDMAFGGVLPPRRGLRLAAARALLDLPRPVRDRLLRASAGALTRVPQRRRRRVVKSIYAPFALEWLWARYRPDVLVVQRHPLNVASSWREQAIPLFDLTSRPAITAYVGQRGLPLPPQSGNELARVAWCVGLLATVLADALDGHEDWVLATHDDICSDPVGAVRTLADRLRLEWSDDIARFLAASDRPDTGLAPVRVARDQPLRWRDRLTAREADEVTAVLNSFPGRGWVRDPQMARAAAVAGNTA
jgi:hypothetical protein